MAERLYHVLFLCTGNSARSILAEALLNQHAGGRFRAHSAGSFPTGTVNRHALELLARMGIPTAGLRSKSWDEFARPGAPQMDLVITVCDNARAEVCPVWPGHPAVAHWGVPDPAAVGGTELEQVEAFRDVFRTLEHRVTLLAALPAESLDHLALGAAARAIAQR